MSKPQSKAREDFSAAHQSDAARKHAESCGADLLHMVNSSSCDTKAAIVMIKQGAALEVVDAETGYTPLLAASYWGNTDLARELLAQGANPNAKSVDGRTALFEATRFGRTDIMLLLLRAGADVNAADNEGWTPLMTAILNRRDEGARLLLDNRADMALQSEDGSNAMDLAKSQGVLAQMLQQEPERRRVAELSRFMILEARELTSVPRLSLPAAKKPSIANDR